MAAHKINSQPRQSLLEDEVNLRTPWADEGPAMPGEAVRSQKAKGHKTGEWFRTPFWKPRGLDLVNPSLALSAIGDTP